MTNDNMHAVDAMDDDVEDTAEKDISHGCQVLGEGGWKATRHGDRIIVSQQDEGHSVEWVDGVLGYYGFERVDEERGRYVYELVEDDDEDDESDGELVTDGGVDRSPKPPKRFETPIETFASHSDMTQREAEAYVYREIANLSRSEAADLMDVSPSTVDSHVQSAKPKAKLPDIDVVKRVSARNTGFEEGRAYEIWFANGAMLRYVWNEDRDQIAETTTRADDPHSIWKQYPVGGTEDELAEYAIESIAEYTQNFRDDVEACRNDWDPIYEAIVCHRA